MVSLNCNALLKIKKDTAIAKISLIYLLSLKQFSPVFHQEIVKKNSEDNSISARLKMSKDKAASYPKRMISLIIKQTVT